MITETKNAVVSVSDTDVIAVQVVIGDGQAGGWAVQVGANVTKGDDSDRHDVGTGTDVRAAKLVQVSTVVRDVRPETDHLSATITLLRNGVPAQTILHSRDGTPGDSAHFTSLFLV